LWRRAALAAVLAVLWLVTTGPAASAHAMLRGSDPAAGASLDRAPGRVTLTFTEAPDLALSVVHVLDTSGREVSPGPLAVAARWAFYWGFALLLGAAATGLLVFERRLPARAGLLLGAALALAG